MPTQPSAIIFDIGNVLVNWDPDLLYSQILPDPTERRALFEEAGLDEMNLSVDRGAPFRETVYATAMRHPEHAEAIRAWHDRWEEMFTPPIVGTWDILRDLRASGSKVFALSNFGRESFELAERIYPQLAEFDKRFISAHLGVIKPEARIYEIVEEETGLSGADLFFIDDRADNIAAAKSRGWLGYQFGTPDGLRTALAESGVEL